MTEPTPRAALVSAVVDEVIDRFGGGEHEPEIARARAEYDERRGRVFEDEPLWEVWTQAFLEWYAVERPFGGDALPPAARLLRDLGPGQGDERRAAAVRALLRSHRSLFEVTSVRAGTCQVVDLIGGAHFGVEEKRALHGVAAGDVLEARVVGLDGAVLFGRTFLFHPAGTRDAIARHVARLAAEGKGRREIIDWVAGLRVRCERYRHLSPEKMYAQGGGGVAGGGGGGGGSGSGGESGEG